jgi:hypothetical protein
LYRPSQRATAALRSVQGSIMFRRWAGARSRRYGTRDRRVQWFILILNEVKAIAGIGGWPSHPYHSAQ